VNSPKPLSPFGKKAWGLLFLLGTAVVTLGIIAGLCAKETMPSVQIEVVVSTPTARPTFTSTPSPTTIPSPTPTSPPTPTATRVVGLDVYQTATARSIERATSRANSTATTTAKPAVQPASANLTKSPTRNSRLVLAHYFAWYDGNGWDNCNISAGDKPLAPYSSDDPAAIARHIQLAQEAGLNGFTLHWFAPGDRTDQNFGTLLAQSEGQDFLSTIVFSHHIWPGTAHSHQTIGDALQYVIDSYGSHPNFLRLNNKPVIFFTDVYRTPATGDFGPRCGNRLTRNTKQCGLPKVWMPRI